MTAANTREIRYDRETRDFAMYLDGELVGWAATSHDAEVALDKIVLERIARQTGAMPMMPVARDDKAITARNRGTLVQSHSNGVHTVEVYVAAEMAHHSRDTLWHCFLVDGAYHGRFMGQQEAEAEFNRIVTSWLPVEEQAAERELLAARPAEPEPEAVFVDQPQNEDLVTTLLIEDEVGTCDICEETKPADAFSLNSGSYAETDTVACDHCIGVMRAVERAESITPQQRLEALLRAATQVWREMHDIVTPFDSELAYIDAKLSQDSRLVAAGRAVARQAERNPEAYARTMASIGDTDRRLVDIAYQVHLASSAL